jgi:AraC family transcriptional regulator
MIIMPSEVPKYVPGTVTAASDDLGWNGVLLRAYHYTGLDVIVPPVRDFTIVSYRGGATFMERRCDGAWTRTHCEPGDVSLLTRSERSHWRWTEDIHVSHVYRRKRWCPRFVPRSWIDALPMFTSMMC